MAITPLKKMFGERIRMYLVTNKIRQQELARRLSVSSSAVSQMLTGKIVPSMQQLDKICEVFSRAPADCRGDVIYYYHRRRDSRKGVRHAYGIY